MEVKDLLGFLDIDAKSIDEVKEKFNEKFAPKSEVEDAHKKLSEFTGKFSGGATTLFKRLGGLENKDIEGKKWEEVAEMAINKYKAQIEELEGKTGQGSDEALKSIQAKLDKVAKERDDYRLANETLASTYEKEKGDWEGKLRNFKTNNVLESAKAKIAPKLKTDMSVAERIAFESVIKEFVIDFDDQDSPFVTKGGKRIPNPNKAGSFLSVEEALEVSANELAIIKKNNGNNGTPVNQSFFAGSQNQNNNTQTADPTKNTAGRSIHPSAIAHAERLKA